MSSLTRGGCVLGWDDHGKDSFELRSLSEEREEMRLFCPQVLVSVLDPTAVILTLISGKFSIGVELEIATVMSGINQRPRRICEEPCLHGERLWVVSLQPLAH